MRQIVADTESPVPPHPDPLPSGEREKSVVPRSSLSQGGEGEEGRATSTVSRGAVVIAAMLQASLSQGERVPERSEGG